MSNIATSNSFHVADRSNIATSGSFGVADGSFFAAVGVFFQSAGAFFPASCSSSLSIRAFYAIRSRMVTSRSWTMPPSSQPTPPPLPQTPFVFTTKATKRTKRRDACVQRSLHALPMERRNGGPTARPMPAQVKARHERRPGSGIGNGQRAESPTQCSGAWREMEPGLQPFGCPVGVFLGRCPRLV